MPSSQQLLLLSLALASSWAASITLTSDLHRHMSPEELAVYFDVVDADQIDAEDYALAHVRKEIRASSTGFDKREGNADATDEVSFSMDVLGKTLSVRMRPNAQLLAATADVVVVGDGEDGNKERRVDVSDLSQCHFVSVETSKLGSLSDCMGQVHGFVMDDDASVYDVKPLTQALRAKVDNDSMDAQLHLVKRSRVLEAPLREGIDWHRAASAKKRASADGLVIETALFVDAAAYKTYMNFYKNDEQKVVNLALTYMNGIQALYHYPSLGRAVDFSIVRLEMQKTARFDDGGGERNHMLEGFCKYQAGSNVASDADPKHWDIGLLASGVDFWDDSTGSRSYATMGLATVTGVCDASYGCVIGELGVAANDGRPYPSTGFTSVYVMAHEIGHNLGMFHDSTQGSFASCPNEGFVMSPTRGVIGETMWSDCSRNLLASLDMACLKDKPAAMPSALDHNKFGNYPGRAWTPDEQCQMLLKNANARHAHTASDMATMCGDSLKCFKPNDIGSGEFYAGPALEGTACGNNLFCIQGKCQQKTFEDKPPAAAAPPQWSDWKSDGQCAPACIDGDSQGAITRHRDCLVPKPVSTSDTCPGPAVKSELCFDFALSDCKKKYASPVEYATAQCALYRQKSAVLKDLIKDEGKMARHNPEREEQACMVQCRMAASTQWYSPQAELNNDAELSAFFPEGTACHEDRGSSYFCVGRKCLPPSGRSARGEAAPKFGFSQNARPDQEDVVPDDVRKYFTLDDNDQPLSSAVPQGQSGGGADAQFELNDENVAKPK